MTTQITVKNFTSNLFDLLDETFENVHGAFLDRGTSLYETLATISAEEASIPVSASCASLAAQLAHVIFYMEVTERYLLKQEIGRVDWGEVWRTVEKVTPEQWEASQQKLKATYQRITSMLKGIETWDDEDTIGGAIVIVVHTAYHLGEIRQALCTLKPPTR